MKINKEFYFNGPDNVQKSKTKKKQIVLINSLCTLDEHIVKIKTRYNGKYTKMPCFFVSKNGEIYQHFDPNNYNNLMDEQRVEKQVIVIALENVGWLYKDALSGNFITWKGTTYDGDVSEVPWRNKKYWANYTDEQYDELVELINYLCIEHNIIKEFVGNNVIIEKPNNYRGILNRSNYSKNYYDLSPAMNFKKLKELIEKENEK